MRLLWFLLAAFLRLARSLRPNVKRLPAYHTDLDEETKPPKPVLRQLSVNVEVPTSPDAHRVHSLPLFDDTENFPLSWAGHLPASADGTKYLFYWLFAPEGDEAVGADAPLVLWLNGGPGTSSMVGLFVENGPFQFVLDPASGHYSLQRRDYSWHKAPAYVLYLDQPVGTGYSFTTRDDNYPQSNRECGIDVHYFLQQFFQLHADKFVVRNNDGHGQPMTKDFYVTGESHAGQYIPAIMAYILERNDQSPDIYINLKAGAIGNGSTDPYWQWNTGVAAYGHGMLGIQHLQWLTAQEQICQANLDSGSCDSCFDWYKVIDNVLGHYRHGTNYRAVMYDIRKAKGPGLPSYPPYEDVLKVYLRGADGFGNIGTVSKQVVHALNAGVLLDVYEGEYFGGGLDELRDALDEEWVEIKHGAIEHVQYVLQHESVRLLFYNGVYDLACDHVGNELFLSNMEWKYQKEWLEATRYAWIAESEKPGAVSGYIKEYANLGFLKGTWWMFAWVVHAPA